MITLYLVVKINTAQHDQLNQKLKKNTKPLYKSKEHKNIKNKYKTHTATLIQTIELL